MIETVLETWRVHDDLNFFLLRRISEAGMRAVTLLKNGQPSTGRDVARVFAHIHNVRVSHVPKGFQGSARLFENGVTPSKSELEEALRASGSALAELLRASLERDPRVKNYDRTGIRLLGYLISHESHHRGQVMLALKQSGVRLPEDVRFGLWTTWLK
jgi:uncharacterized damage-inducible protein DinB